MASGVGAPRLVRERQGQNNEQRSNAQSSPKLEFHQAMRDFKHMFPTLDDEIIEAVLRANNGLVDATIDQLLVMGAGSESEKTDFTETSNFPSLPSYSQTTEHNEPPPAYTPRADEEQLLDISDTTELSPPPVFSSHSDIRATQAYRAWNPPLLGQLPVDFLRLDLNETGSTSNSEPVRSPKSSTEQFLEDEKIALYLQNEEFMRELSRNQEFLSSLERDQNRTSQVPNTQAQEPEGVAAPQQEMQGRADDPQVFAVSPNSDEDFKEKLKHMGKSTRRKFNQLAKVFSRKKRPLNVTTIEGISTANLLQEYEDDSEDDDELLRNHESLEPLEESDSEAEEGQRTRQQPSAQTASRRNDPVEFFAENNEFQYKQEDSRN